MRTDVTPKETFPPSWARYMKDKIIDGCVDVMNVDADDGGWLDLREGEVEGRPRGSSPDARVADGHGHDLTAQVSFQSTAQVKEGRTDNHRAP